MVSRRSLQREAAALEALLNDDGEDAAEAHLDGILGRDDFFKPVDQATAERLGVTVESVGDALMAAGGRFPT